MKPDNFSPENLIKFGEDRFRFVGGFAKQEQAYTLWALHPYPDKKTSEGFWALVKRAFYGQHHHYSKKYSALYIAEACFKYNNRDNKNPFPDMLGLMVGV